ncbi:nucleotide sugar dehydrogenase [Vaginisenegalia massiliensis]|uniref:nucleotide sugar dehydrogenase n=1 Tax=Vaginisenegalia massiliensis TaxID=2058294 RepID=UPI000F525D07|nr:nucleotide sugar dehydrogenase [Vaginisenegalia massiliensis]
MINVIGLGYIGLPTALMLAANGNEVVGTDILQKTVENLQQGKLTFEEKNLDTLFKKAVDNGIQFSTNYQETDMYIITVPTPYDLKTKKIDPSYVIEAVKTTVQNAKNNSIIVVESTVSPGTHDKFVKPIIHDAQKILGKTLHLVHAPERILPGNMVYELEHNSRTIGADDIEAANKVKKLYETFCKGEIVVTDIRSAEMSKVIENTFRDVNIAFANELAKIASYNDMDVYEIIRIANKHPRVNILNPGPGVGGHCISVDPWFLVGDFPELTKLIKISRDINDSMPTYVLKKIHDIMKEKQISDISRVGLYGLTYKPNVDDVRESPTLQLLEKQREHLAPELKVFDPYISKKIAENQYFNFEEFLKDIDLVVIMVAHEHIKQNKELLNEKVIFDTQNIFENSEKVYKL